MFARYAYIKGATPANILADVCAILCGTTDKTALSAACDQAATEIHFSLNPATFTLHDNAATATGKVLKQRAADNSCDKFLHLSAITTTFRWGASETWDADTHVGTNSVGNGSTSFDSSNTSLASSFNPVNNTGFIYLYSDPYLTLLAFRSTAISYSYVPLIETTREGPLMLLEYGYPNWGVGELTNSSFRRPGAKNNIGSGAVTCNAVVSTSGVLAGFLTKSPYTSNGISSATARTTTEAAITSLFCIKDFPAFTVTTSSVQEYIGKCLSEVKFGTGNITGVIGDEFIHNSITHVFLPSNRDIFYGFSTFIPKG